ncbi:HAD hydrolase-like protein [Antrihabitans cavernicola]|uniref:HAD family hydrolase n=1 Tax=Antrihabitans cavernicola TaxID=2495913 RepID=A0A5A7SF74_9NOCA|nr:HAD hydrolase-like protein [Spelaeibacter cavernicola]KAA0023185.1 HAD family hydrolase [Spelaeibacter cavernicola]
MLFDLDGTLTDSAPGILAGFRHALSTIGEPEPSAELLATVVGPPMVDTFRAMGIDEVRTAQAIAAYFDSYDEGGGWADNSVFDGMEPIVAALSADGTRLGIATSKFQGYAVRILEHFGLAKYFEFIGGASKDLERRTKADVIAHTLRNMQIEPIVGGTEGVVLVGDREHDVAGAAHWGIPTVYAGWGYGVDGESDGASLIADTVPDLARVLDVRV